MRHNTRNSRLVLIGSLLAASLGGCAAAPTQHDEDFWRQLKRSDAGVDFRPQATAPAGGTASAMRKRPAPDRFAIERRKAEDQVAEKFV